MVRPVEPSAFADKFDKVFEKYLEGEINGFPTTIFGTPDTKIMLTSSGCSFKGFLPEKILFLLGNFYFFQATMELNGCGQDEGSSIG